MRIAIVGSGVSGLVCAYLLHRHHQITVFEAADYAGGHVNTRDVHIGGRRVAVDTGFIVYNDRNYPNFIKLLTGLGLQTQASDMSFSVRCEKTGLEYNGTSIDGLFAQRANLLRPAFYRMVRDILRFNRNSLRLLSTPGAGPVLGSYLQEERYSREFVDHYLVPMCAAIWSSAPAAMMEFPARYLVSFLNNHGMLSIDDRPQWRTVSGGSRRYVEALTAKFEDCVRLNTPVARVAREHGGIKVQTATGECLDFEQVVMACHSDQALALLGDASEREREVLGSFSYQANETLLHTDESLLPRRRKAWASWNYHVPRESSGAAEVTYLMNRLQNLDLPQQLCVTLNRSSDIDSDKVLARMLYHHPLYDGNAVAAQSRHAEVSGVNNTHYCGAYWGYGFHEDGVNSALRVGNYFGESL